jgi:glutamate racemase
MAGMANLRRSHDLATVLKPLNNGLFGHIVLGCSHYLMKQWIPARAPELCYVTGNGRYLG